MFASTVTTTHNVGRWICIVAFLQDIASRGVRGNESTRTFLTLIDVRSLTTIAFEGARAIRSKVRNRIAIGTFGFTTIPRFDSGDQFFALFLANLVKLPIPMIAKVCSIDVATDVKVPSTLEHPVISFAFSTRTWCGLSCCGWSGGKFRRSGCRSQCFRARSTFSESRFQGMLNIIFIYAPSAFATCVVIGGDTEKDARGTSLDNVALNRRGCCRRC